MRRMWCHGYQSWSESTWRTVSDGAATSAAPSLVRQMHGPETSFGGLQSELVTMFDDDGTVFAGENVLLLVDGELHGATETHESLDAWASAQPGRAGAPFQVGWCSWYQYFDRVTEDDIRANLALADDWPFDVFQIDDGFQSAIGDWRTTNDKFPSSLERLAADIASAGRRPGLWIAPFLAAPDSDVAQAHPEWFATHRSGRRLVGSFNEHWGGAVHVLDTTQPEVLDHLEQLARDLVEMGFTYLKLDFTYAPGLLGRFRHLRPTTRERVRLGFEAIRRGAGEDAFLLGCGAPIASSIGLVDGMRIGPDVAPWWEPREHFPGYAAVAPSTVNALRATEARQFMHRRLWLNDPDCVMLRTTDTDMTPAQVEQWAMAVGDSGGMVIVSDDLSLLDANARALFDDVVARGREADAQAIGSTSARTNVR